MSGGLTFWRYVAIPERVSGISWDARALGQVVNNVTLRVLAASSRAGVSTFISDAGFVGGTVGVQNALGSAALVRVANVIGQASTRPGSIAFFTNGISTTG